MQRNLGSIRIDEDNQNQPKCEECGTSYQKPLLATVSSRGLVQTYYACPRCLSKKGSPEQEESQGSKNDDEAVTPESSHRRVMPKMEDNAECKHSMGYLKKRPKDTPIPDECLTCGKMVECLIK